MLYMLGNLTVHPCRWNLTPPPPVLPLSYSALRNNVRNRGLRWTIAVASICIALYLGITSGMTQLVAVLNQWKLEASAPPADSEIYSDSPPVIAGLQGQPLYEI